MVSRGVLVKNIITLLDGNSSKKVSTIVAEFLLKSDRTNELQSILRDVTLARHESDSIVEVTAVSASPLLARHESEIKKNIKKLYPGARTIIVNNKIDESLIGGIKLEFPDRQLDMSVESRITKLRKLIS